MEIRRGMSAPRELSTLAASSLDEEWASIAWSRIMRKRDRTRGTRRRKRAVLSAPGPPALTHSRMACTKSSFAGTEPAKARSSSLVRATGEEPRAWLPSPRETASP
ncbi:unnamed protein product, partial [Discosporangium mesarthrocarpum]